MKLAGIVLCGGKSTRMGVPKATLPFGPETMLQRVVRLLGTVVDPIVVVGARDQELPALPPAVLITRDERDARGPLEGLRAGLTALPAAADAARASGKEKPLARKAVRWPFTSPMSAGFTASAMLAAVANRSDP